MLHDPGFELCERLSKHASRCHSLFLEGFLQKLAQMSLPMQGFVNQQAAQLPTLPQNGAPAPPQLGLPMQPGSPTQMVNQPQVASPKNNMQDDMQQLEATQKKKMFKGPVDKNYPHRLSAENIS